MQMPISGWFLMGSLALPVLAFSQDQLNASQTLCINNATQEERRIELIYDSADSPIPCTLYYDKDGSRDEVASAENSTGYCEKIERNMVRNLVSSNWSCQHSLLGALDTVEKQSTALNLFADDTEHSTIQPRAATQEPALPSATQLANDLQAKIEQDYVSTLQQQLEQDAAAALGPQYAVDVTVTLNLTVSIEPRPGLAKADELATPEQTQNMAVSPPRPETQIADHQTTTLFALASRVFTNEPDAHRFAAEFHQIYPDVASRVAHDESANQWRLVLGVNSNRQTLQTGASQLHASTQQHFDIAAIDTNDPASNTMKWVPDDWLRYAIASCYAQGKTTSTELGNCAGAVLDVDTFLSCLAGGVCLPEKFHAELTHEQIDFLEVVGSDDPVAAARGILINSMQGCEHLTDPSSEEAAECVALSILDDDQRELYECYQRDAGAWDLISCTGDDELADNMMLLERCSLDSITMTECVMSEVNNDYLNSAARCVNYGDTEEILSCAIDANLDIDESRVLTCVSYSSSRADQAQCLTREYLDEEQAALLSCAQDESALSDMGLCMAEQRGMLTRDEYLAAECLLEGNTAPDDLLNCAGARFAGTELEQCVADNVPLGECFTTRTIISDVVANEVDMLLETDAIDSQIAMFREELYALEGGDLSDILADEASAEVFAATEEATNEVKKEIKKKKGTLLNRLGFGKK